MKAKRSFLHAIAGLLVVYMSGVSYAYVISVSNGWPGANASYYSQGYAGSNATFDSAFVDALNSWNNQSNFSWTNINASASPCGAPNSTRGWYFNNTHCGILLGGSTLAVAFYWWNPGEELIDADITFNTAYSWDVHSGSGANFDFKRVAVHELGHALGLGHSASTGAIMYPTIGSIETPQSDDIDGLRAIYGSTGASPTVCDIQMSKTTYTAGDTVTATDYRFANPGPDPVPVEAKGWIGIPSGPPVSSLNVGADGSISLPAGFDQDFGPVTLFPASGMPTGAYELSCRLLDPVTGALLAEDLNPFTIQ